MTNKTKTKRPNQSSRLVKAETPNHLKALDPIPPEAYDNPVEWADKHLEKQIPQAAKEVEYALKFGDAKTRREIAKDILSFKGIAKKGDGATQVVPAIQLIMNGSLPWSAKIESGPTTPALIEGEVIKEKK